MDLNGAAITVGSVGAISVAVGLFVPGTTSRYLVSGGAVLGGIGMFMKSVEMRTAPLNDQITTRSSALTLLSIGTVLTGVMYAGNAAPGSYIFSGTPLMVGTILLIASA